MMHVRPTRAQSQAKFVAMRTHIRFPRRLLPAADHVRLHACMTSSPHATWLSRLEAHLSSRLHLITEYSFTHVCCAFIMRARAEAFSVFRFSTLLFCSYFPYPRTTKKKSQRHKPSRSKQSSRLPHLGLSLYSIVTVYHALGL